MKKIGSITFYLYFFNFVVCLIYCKIENNNNNPPDVGHEKGVLRHRKDVDGNFLRKKADTLPKDEKTQKKLWSFKKMKRKNNNTSGDMKENSESKDVGDIPKSHDDKSSLQEIEVKKVEDGKKGGNGNNPPNTESETEPTTFNDNAENGEKKSASKMKNNEEIIPKSEKPELDTHEKEKKTHKGAKSLIRKIRGKRTAIAEAKKNTSQGSPKKEKNSEKTSTNEESPEHIAQNEATTDHTTSKEPAPELILPSEATPEHTVEEKNAKGKHWGKAKKNLPGNGNDAKPMDKIDPTRNGPDILQPTTKGEKGKNEKKRAEMEKERKSKRLEVPNGSTKIVDTSFYEDSKKLEIETDQSQAKKQGEKNDQNLSKPDAGNTAEKNKEEETSEMEKEKWGKDDAAQDCRRENEYGKMEEQSQRRVTNENDIVERNAYNKMEVHEEENEQHQKDEEQNDVVEGEKQNNAGNREKHESLADIIKNNKKFKKVSKTLENIATNACVGFRKIVDSIKLFAKDLVYIFENL
ncbi:hypothetical protein POCGH01_06028400 [Plasmodium ovale]|uniref:Glutamate-rich protein (GLURP) n=2 Tax=Plasmodium ovale TaxID=36330 RepID=A0A1A8XBP7_PLAOA|nr:glutamate-rich protein (GLURP) [Plasmodium ovale curtisi]SBT01284.1 glutamate-rich protein (GLURP) [Plasmodium ovale curtisi]SCP03984.1 hypothetical protein POCGH01_06028400 [Plasmodium ovale]